MMPRNKFYFTTRTTKDKILVLEINERVVAAAMAIIMNRYDISVANYMAGDDEYQQACLQALINGCVHYWANMGLIKISNQQRKMYRKKIKKALKKQGHEHLWEKIGNSKELMTGNIINAMTPSHLLDKLPLWAAIVGRCGMDLDEEEGTPLSNMFEAAATLSEATH